MTPFALVFLGAFSWGFMKWLKRRRLQLAADKAWADATITWLRSMREEDDEV